MRKILPIIMLLLIISVEALAQQTITGRVTDANTRETLPSATVRILGTTTGTVTDMDGNYSIMTISADVILEFSYVGYTKS